MVEPLSVAFGIGIAVAIILVFLGVVLLGRRPGYIVDMRDVRNYEMQKHANEALRQDVDDDENGGA